MIHQVLRRGIPILSGDSMLRQIADNFPRTNMGFSATHRLLTLNNLSVASSNLNGEGWFSRAAETLIDNLSKLLPQIAKFPSLEQLLVNTGPVERSWNISSRNSSSTSFFPLDSAHLSELLLTHVRTNNFTSNLTAGNESRDKMHISIDNLAQGIFSVLPNSINSLSRIFSPEQARGYKAPTRMIPYDETPKANSRKQNKPKSNSFLKKLSQHLLKFARFLGSIKRV